MTLLVCAIAERPPKDTLIMIRAVFIVSPVKKGRIRGYFTRYSLSMAIPDVTSINEARSTKNRLKMPPL